MNLIMTNKEFQSLGKVSRVVGVYLLDDDGERIRKLQAGSEEHSKYRKEELEVVTKKPLTSKEIMKYTEPCPF